MFAEILVVVFIILLAIFFIKMDQNQNVNPNLTRSETSKTSPRDFFLNLVIVAFLYTSIISILNLLFEIINRLFPDALNSGYYYYGYYSSGIRWAIACLIIIFPLYIIFSAYRAKIERNEPEKRNLLIKKWLTYLTLFLSGITIIIDLITFVNYFLNGEVPTRFILKILAVFIVSAIVFGYYFYSLKKEVSTTGGKVMAYISIVIVLASLVGGFLIIGSPMKQRLIRFDERKEQDLRSLQYQIVYYWQRKSALPKNLGEINDPLSSYAVPIDPQSNTAYGYEATGNKLFKICADFNLSSKEIKEKDYFTRNYSKYIQEPLDYTGNTDNWEHEKGYQCFEREIDEKLYPPIQPIKQ